MNEIIMQDDLDIVFPDFEQWAYELERQIIDRLSNTLTHQDYYKTKNDIIASALESAFNQGKFYGYRRGYNIGLEMGWADVLDKATKGDSDV